MNKRILGITVVLLLLVALMAATLASASPSTPNEPSPATVVGTKTLTLRTAKFADDGATRAVDSQYYGIADVFYTVDYTHTAPTAKTIVPSLQFSPDGVVWANRTLPSITSGTSPTMAMTRTALYGTFFRMRFAVTSPINYTPTVKVVFKNLK
jgi:hypothetical protein